MSESDDSNTKGEPQNATEPQPTGEAGLRAGDRIGRYVLISSIGQGGMGVVFLAYDPELDRKVALKLLRLGLLNREGKQRLVREAQAMARLSHPNVVAVYDVGTVEHQAFVAMEYVEGQTLSAGCKTPRAWREVVAVMRDARARPRRGARRRARPSRLQAGQRAHRRRRARARRRLRAGARGRGSVGPLRRDAGRSPRRQTGAAAAGLRAARADVSGAHDEHHSLSQVTRADQIIGTPAYMAPEQVANGACDDRADQFSFGVTFYEALYRQRPYEVTETVEGGQLVTIAEKRASSARNLAAEPPRGIDVPSWVQRIVMRALSHDPIRRFPTMDALLAVLDKDPALARRRVATAVAMVVVLGLGTVGFVRGQAAKRRMCDGALDEVHKAWSPETRERVRLAFGATKLSYAELAFSTLSRVLDQYAVDWSNQYKDACEATRVRGEVSEDVLDLRMACLGDRLKELSALSSVMEHPDNDAVQEAPRAARNLTPVKECADVAALKAETPRPRDSMQARHVDELERRLAEMQAQHAVGKQSEALKLGEALVVDARALGWQPLVAEVELWIGRAAADLGDDTKSIPGFKDAFAAALAGRDDTTLKNAAVRLAQEYIYKNDMPDWDYWQHVAQASLSRGSPDPHLESFLEHDRCVALNRLGRVKERLRCFETHAQKKHDEPLNEWELTMLGIAAGDAGQFAEAIDWLQRGVDFATKEFGPTHPRTIEMRAYLCKGLRDPRRVRQGAHRVSGRLAHRARGGARQSIFDHAPAALPRLDAARDEALRRGQEAAAARAEGRQGRGAARPGADRDRHRRRQDRAGLLQEVARRRQQGAAQGASRSHRRPHELRRDADGERTGGRGARPAGAGVCRARRRHEPVRARRRVVRLRARLVGDAAGRAREGAAAGARGAADLRRERAEDRALRRDTETHRRLARGSRRARGGVTPVSGSGRQLALPAGPSGCSVNGLTELLSLLTGVSTEEAYRLIEVTGMILVGPLHFDAPGGGRALLDDGTSIEIEETQEAWRLTFQPGSRFTVEQIEDAARRAIR